jgi:GNAT superfamily N-acetyltransferase
VTTRQEIAALALCLERAEAAGCEAKLLGLNAYKARSNPYEVARIGHTILLSAPRSRGSFAYNRALAFSSSDYEHLDDILQWLRERDAYWFDIAPVLVDGRSLQPLVDDGLHRASDWDVVVQNIAELAGSPGQGTHVQEINLENPDHLSAFGAVVYHGHTFPAPLVAAMHRTERAKYSMPAWHTYLATFDDEPAALAALHIAEGVATLGELNAIPRFRGRGCQTALVQRVIADAAQAGCEWIAARTKPGSDKERILIRTGFEVAYTKHLYTRASRAHFDQ